MPERSPVTDRALRYRANRHAPPGPRRCHYCGRRQNVEVEHVDGYEEHGAPENLTWACRSCNTRKGIAFKAAGIGRKTHQFNPNPYSFSAAAAGLAGRRTGAAARKAGGRLPFGVWDSWLRDHLASLPSEPTAREVKQWREAFYTGVRQRSNPAGAQNLAQWVNAVLSLKGEGGTMSLPDAIAMVHATPHAQRSRFAQEIWNRRRSRASEVPF
ncbi:MAG: HNH endonuclease [Acidobacteriia bacterium]|nr:HNH endonuclease [Terriglobia bacterium]